MPADVIEVDFTAKREPESIEEIAEQVDDAFQEMLSGIDDVRTAFERQERRWQSQLDAAWGTIASLRRALHAECARAWRFSDEDVLRVLGELYAGEPVAASSIAARLDGREPTQSLRVRTGHALSRLHARGLVRRERSRSTDRWSAYRWMPAVGSDDAR